MALQTYGWVSDFGAFNTRLQKISAIVISLAIVWFSLLFFHAAPAFANFPG